LPVPLKHVEEKHSELATRLGVHINIGHMIPLGIRPQNLSDLHGRILSVDISDHGAGHFADLAPGRYHGIREFQEWPESTQDRAKVRRSPDADIIGQTCNVSP
jgi:hypothetical protein